MNPLPPLKLSPFCRAGSPLKGGGGRKVTVPPPGGGTTNLYHSITV